MEKNHEKLDLYLDSLQTSQITETIFWEIFRFNRNHIKPNVTTINNSRSNHANKQFNPFFGVNAPSISNQSEQNITDFTSFFNNIIDVRGKINFIAMTVITKGNTKNLNRITWFYTFDEFPRRFNNILYPFLLTITSCQYVFLALKSPHKMIGKFEKFERRDSKNLDEHHRKRWNEDIYLQE
ncbi:hypothetical protein DERP_004822 [Dermatophagoides pteronyssinus]|uniref:Uncharacterized protein n=1 Tax=Dermatophagoides pteronyssinus TaxID=6956 RepID=A0ABQ8JSL5_DERPT|nr:hypothetical protein DERP_004822 [Dermatophagoides pteronyssinus]